MYLIGEALLGQGEEVAHIDLLIGDKDGPVGMAFANALSQLSAGHTPLLAVIRPNLPPKPYTLIIPKVTIKNMEDASKIFGAGQNAVAKAVADSVEEGIIPKDKVEDWVLIVSVFIHPKATDLRKVYSYNYGATKLAITRAINKKPNLERILWDKDRARHPIMGFTVPRLWRPPYLQIALDITNFERIEKIIKEIPKSDRILLEVGTPLLKKYGTKIISDLRKLAKSTFIVCDLKTLDVGRVEVLLAFEETADAVVASGLASDSTLNIFMHEAKRLGIYSIIDMMNVQNPIERIKSLKQIPDVVILHRGIDTESNNTKPRWELIKEIKGLDKKLLVAVAGGISPITMTDALKEGADIIIVGRYITQARDPERSVREFLHGFETTLAGITKEWGEIDHFRVNLDEE
ncbi:MAG: bifunctional 5,6,7,8-tetrahydromethanopterin hydro-lyase/3-hexulose-6-phosphate synthase [Candidatus Helarchaeota archaeon]